MEDEGRPGQGRAGFDPQVVLVSEREAPAPPVPLVEPAGGREPALLAKPDELSGECLHFKASDYVGV